MFQLCHKLSKRFTLLQSLLLQTAMITLSQDQNVPVQTKIKSNAVHVGHSQLQPHSHKVDVLKVLIRHSHNTHKNTLLLVIQSIKVATVVILPWFGDS